MRKLYVVQGNYETIVTKALEQFLPNIVTPSSNGNDELLQLEKDLHRTAYFSEKLSTKEIQEKLVQELKKFPNNIVNQGDLDGRIYSLKRLPTSNTEPMPIASTKLLASDCDETVYNGIHLNYINENNISCALSLELIRDDTNTDLAIEDRPFHCAITIIENVLAPIQDRKITFIVDENLARPDLHNAEISADESLKTIENSLKCPLLFGALKEILSSKFNISKDNFDQLRTCILNNINSFHFIKRLSACKDSNEIESFLKYVRVLQKIRVEHINSALMNYFSSQSIEQLSTKDFIDQVKALENISPKNLIALLATLPDESPENISRLFTEIQNANIKSEKNALGINIGINNQLKKDIEFLKSNRPDMEFAANQSFIDRNRANINGLAVSLLIMTAVVVAAALFASPLGIFTIPLATAAFGLIALGSFIVGVFNGKKIYDTQSSVNQYVSHRDEEISHLEDNALTNQNNKLNKENDKYNEDIAQFIKNHKTTNENDLDEPSSISDLFSQSNRQSTFSPANSHTSPSSGSSSSNPYLEDEGLSEDENTPGSSPRFGM